MPISGYPVSAHPISANIPKVISTTVALDWLVQFSNPVFRKAHITSQQHPYALGQSPIVPTNSWFYGLTDPTRLKRPTSYQQDTLAPVQPTPAAFTFYPMALVEPFINVKPRVATYGPVLSGLPVKTLAGGDPFFANTVLLANFNGTNGQTSWNDQSAAANGPATFFNTVSITNTNQLFGNNTLESSGAATNRIQWTNNPSQYSFGTNPFTLEIWTYCTLFSTEALLGQWGPNFNWLIWFDATNINFTNLSSNTDISFAPSSFLNAWHFIAVDFDGTTQRLYFDGTLVSSATITRNLNRSGTAITTMADTNGGSLTYAGSIGPIRVTSGVARYAGNGSVPTNIFPTS